VPGRASPSERHGARPSRTPPRVRLGHKVEDGTNRWVPGGGEREREGRGGLGDGDGPIKEKTGRMRKKEKERRKRKEGVGRLG